MATATSKTAPKKAKASSSEGFAVIKTGGKQYKVSAGDTIKIEKFIGDHKVGDKVVFEEVLLVDTGSATQVGAPFIAGAKVSGEIVEIDRNAKVIAARYIQKNRSGFKKNGHRQPYFKIKINALA
ncbi:MAG TPA: 50S ribosomal protein L21 [Candidatus Paceibacterota bacterium]